MPVAPRSNDRLIHLGLVAWTTIGIVLLALGALWLIGRISGVLTPFVFAALIVFVLRRPVSLLRARGLSRATAVTACYLVAVLVLTFAGLFVIPPLVAQAREFIDAFPGYYESAAELWVRIQGQLLDVEIPAWLEEAAEAARTAMTQQLAGWSRSVAEGIVGIGGRAVGFVINLFLTLALAFFVLKDLPTFKKEILQLGGVQRRADLVEVIERVARVVDGWLRGQSLIALMVGIATWLGLAVLGVPYALIIGIIAGITNLIPYLGPLVGGAVAAISAAFVSPQLVLWTVLWIVVVQQLESLFLQPRIMSQEVNLHPVLVIFSLLVGASLAGLLGMLFAVPIAGVANTLFVYYFERHTDSELATEDGALFRKTGCEGAEGKFIAGEPCPEETETEDHEETSE